MFVQFWSRDLVGGHAGAYVCAFSPDMGEVIYIDICMVGGAWHCSVLCLLMVLRVWYMSYGLVSGINGDKNFLFS